MFLFLIFMTLTILPWYTGVILAMALFFGMHHVRSNFSRVGLVDERFWPDRYPRAAQRLQLHRQRNPKPVLLRDHLRFLHLGRLLLGHPPPTPYVPGIELQMSHV